MRWTEANIFELLAEKYPGPEWATFPQVGNGTGFSRARRRTADALAFNLWPSRGLALEGFEIKTSRSDWRREARDPGKAESIAQFCSKWWIVAPKGVVPVGELPQAWGLLETTTAELEPGKTKLRIKKQAEVTKAKELDRLMVASIIRAGQKLIEHEQLEKRRASTREVEERVRDRVKAELERRSLTADRAFKTLQENVQAFEAASGVRINAYEGARIGRAVKLVLKHEGSMTLVLDHLKKRAAAALAAGQAALDQLADEDESEEG